MIPPLKDEDLIRYHKHLVCYNHSKRVHMDIIAKNWKDYECIDAGDGEKIDRWKDIILRRPDPTAIWPKTEGISDWDKAHGYYHRSSKGGGSWDFKRKIPENWTINYQNLTFKVSPTGFKHTGIFPEQSANWGIHA